MAIKLTVKIWIVLYLPNIFSSYQQCQNILFHWIDSQWSSAGYIKNTKQLKKCLLQTMVENSWYLLIMIYFSDSNIMIRLFSNPRMTFIVNLRPILLMKTHLRCQSEIFLFWQRKTFDTFWFCECKKQTLMWKCVPQWH